MRNLLQDHDLEEMIEILQIGCDQQLKLVSWQTDPGKDERKIFYAAILSVDPEGLSFKIFSTENKMFDLEKRAVYFYMPAQKCIFRCEQIYLDPITVELAFPTELKLLDEPADQKLQSGFKVDFTQENQKRSMVEGLKRKQVDDIQRVSGTAEKIETKWVQKLGSQQNLSDNDSDIFEKELSHKSVDEEEMAFAGTRVDPRARARGNRSVKIASLTDSNSQTYSLFDLSRSGLAFIVPKQHNFSLHQNLQVLGFDTNVFDAPMIIQVMNIRAIDKQQFKLGCRFLSQEEIDAL